MHFLIEYICSPPNKPKEGVYTLLPVCRFPRRNVCRVILIVRQHFTDEGDLTLKGPVGSCPASPRHMTGSTVRQLLLHINSDPIHTEARRADFGRPHNAVTSSSSSAWMHRWLCSRTNPSSCSHRWLDGPACVLVFCSMAGSPGLAWAWPGGLVTHEDTPPVS
jgi:hypothetical protein